MAAIIKKWTKYLPSSFDYDNMMIEYKYGIIDNLDNEDINKFKIEKYHDNSVYVPTDTGTATGVVETHKNTINNIKNIKNPLERKFLLKAKINALEEYVEHLENLLKSQELYIQQLETKTVPTHKKRLSF
jgi:hypothetical protein